MNVLKVGLIGADGRLGRAIQELSDASFAIAASFTREYPADAAAPIDLFIDVSSLHALDHNLNAALLAQKPIVVGTTGHANIEKLQDASRTIPVFYSANFSLGMAVMRQAALLLVKKFHHSTAINLVETHHAHKKDAPSGSAVLLASSIEKVHPAKVNIQSIRSGDAIGEHALHFHAEEERLTLIHAANHRAVFARGAIVAAKFLAKQSPGFFGMDDLLA